MKLQTFLVTLLCVEATLLEAAEFILADGTEYYISYPLRKNWFQAQRFCTYYGLHLISIHSFEEEQIILSVIKGFKTKHNITSAFHLHMYTSGSDLGHLTNEFYWVTTSHPFVYTNWRNGYPTKDRTKPDLSGDCVILDDQFDLKWENLNCSSEYFFMCQNRIVVPLVNRTNDLKNCQTD